MLPCPDDCFVLPCPDDCFVLPCPDDCFVLPCPDDCFVLPCPDVHVHHRVLSVRVCWCPQGMTHATAVLSPQSAANGLTADV